MGAKTSKSANITSSPKKDLKEAVVAVEENHVLNGDAGKGDANHVIEVAKDEVKEIVKEMAQEAVIEVKEMAKEVIEVVNGGADENKTPTKEKEEKEEKKKVQKKRSFRRFSFLRKDKNKSKEDKLKNGEIAPEKKEEEKPVVNGEGGENAEKTEVTTEEKPKEGEEVKTPETKAEEPPKEAPKVEEKKEEVPAVVMNGEKEEKAEEPPKAEEKKEAAEVSEKAESFVESVTKEMKKMSVDEKVIDSCETNGTASMDEEITLPETNGMDGTHSKEIVASE